MTKAWDDIEKTYKKLQPQIKKLDGGKADKQVKLTKTALQKAWDEEEKFIDAYEAAQKSGLKGKKPKDFMGDPGFKKAHAALTKQAGEHATIVKALMSDSEVAKKLGKPLTKLLGDIKKEITKGDKAQAKFQKEVQEAEASAKKIATAIGKLTMPELFYGPQIVRVIDKIINKSKAAKGPSGDAEKLIEAKELAKNLKTAIGLMKSAEKLCKDALKTVKKDPEAAEPLLEKAQEAVEELEGIDKAYQKVIKKNAKLIKEAKEKSKIERSIKGISKAHDTAAKTHAVVEKAVGKAVKKADA
jgi:hypothetical protein